MIQICENSEELENIKDAPKTLREYIKNIDSDGHSHIWLISDSADNQKTISKLIRDKKLAVRDIPQGLIDALIEQKVFTRAELGKPEEESNCFKDLVKRVKEEFKWVSAELDKLMAYAVTSPYGEITIGSFQSWVLFLLDISSDVGY